MGDKSYEWCEETGPQEVNKMNVQVNANSGLFLDNVISERRGIFMTHVNGKFRCTFGRAF